MRTTILTLSFVVLVAARASSQQPPPRFTSGVDVTSVDVTVLDGDGRPIRTLTPGDFRVRIDGRDRRVVTADWVSLVTDPAAAATFVPDGYSSNENTTGGRLFVIAIDQPNIRFGGGLAIAHAAADFIDRLEPSDRVAVVGFGVGAPSMAFTADRQRAKAALSRMVGQKQAVAVINHHVTLAEAQAIENGDEMLLEQVQERECAGLGSRLAPSNDACRTEVQMEVADLGQNLRHESDMTMRGLRDVLTGLSAVPAPKTMILISEGFVLNDETFTVEVGALASAARTTLYAIRLDDSVFEPMMERKIADSISDRETRAAGLETLVAAARGSVVNVSGTGRLPFERLQTELSGYYLVGVESDPNDRDGKPHSIKVDVSRRKATVRARRQYVNITAPARSVSEAVIAALRMPLLMPALPLRVVSFALRGPERDRIQLLVHGDVGTDYTAARTVSLGYLLLDSAGRLVDSEVGVTRLAPVMSGVPSPLQYTLGASIPPGDYTLKLVVADGDKVGSVEHAVHASLTEVNGIGLSELIVGGPTAVASLVRPTVGYTASFGSVHGYLEAYGPKMSGVSVKYEIAAGDGGPALLTADAPPQYAGEERALFSRVVPVQQLPAGKYVLRAVVSQAGEPVKTLTRGFEIAPPAVLMASAEGAGAASPDGSDLYLPVADELLARPFQRDEAVAVKTTQTFRARVPVEARTTFDSGVASIVSGDYAKAEAVLKKVIQPEIDSAASLSYLAVCFAASGHDPEAASAWQSALAEGGDIPQIYEWLGDALIRTHNLNEARSAYEEALEKWPSDTRFTKPLAMIYAVFGRGREAVLTLERYLAGSPDDRDALFLAVQWLYHVRAAGRAVQTPAQDARLAHTYALAYEQAGGPQLPLVRQWIAFLEK